MILTSKNISNLEGIENIDFNDSRLFESTTNNLLDQNNINDCTLIHFSNGNVVLKNNNGSFIINDSCEITSSGSQFELIANIINDFLKDVRIRCENNKEDLSHNNINKKIANSIVGLMTTKENNLKSILREIESSIPNEIMDYVYFKETYYDKLYDVLNKLQPSSYDYYIIHL